MIMPLLNHLTLQQRYQYSQTGLNGTHALQIVVLALFVSEHDRVILNTVQERSRKMNRALLHRARLISTNVLLMVKEQNGDQ